VQSNNIKKFKLPLIIGSLGVVYGDIGTSPLYALKSSFAFMNLLPTESSVLGIVSLIIWTLFFIVSIKYVLLVMRADNKNEGGILVLSSLCSKISFKRFLNPSIVLGIIGATLFFSDSILTPAISILSAVEGISIVSHHLEHFIIPITIVLIVLLFYVQSHGSGNIGKFFGPIMMLWFGTLAVLGIYNIIQAPQIFKALNPYYIISFIMENGFRSFIVLGGIFLVVTGAEALYADLGHFGRKSIVISWNYFVFPALVLNYLGQGALLLNKPEAISNPFYHLAPEFLLYPLIFLATVATIIASQSVISGIFSVTWQAIMLNYLPKIRIKHTSDDQIGQVYAPVINSILCLLTITAVLIFKTSDNLAAAYGFSVSGVMLITTILVSMVALKLWKWSLSKTLLLFIPLIAIDMIFFTTNLLKLFGGGWFPALIAGLVCYICYVWVKGNKAINSQKFLDKLDLKLYLKEYSQASSTRIPGTAIFMSRYTNKVPNSLITHLKHNIYLHKHLVFVTIKIADIPKVANKNRFFIKKINEFSYSVTGYYGFNEMPDINYLTNILLDKDIIKSKEEISIFFTKGLIVPSPRMHLEGFSEKLFIFLNKISLSAYDFYKVPIKYVIELGVRYKI
jgi:KUP system potassium uptake protein